jgi:hypothetical protein
LTGIRRSNPLDQNTGNANRAAQQSQNACPLQPQSLKAINIPNKKAHQMNGKPPK